MLIAITQLKHQESLVKHQKLVIARRKGKLWYVAGLNGKTSPQTLQLNFNFLGNSDYSLQLFKDGADTKSITSETRNIKKQIRYKFNAFRWAAFQG